MQRHLHRDVESCVVRNCFQIIDFKDRQMALSFVSLLDGYYRLQEDYHHHLCEDVESPMITQLRSLRSHGPVR